MIIYIINVSLYNIIINFYPRLYILISTKSFQHNFKVNFTVRIDKKSLSVVHIKKNGIIEKNISLV